MADEIITRKEARAQGRKRYFTGKPCKHGHVSERTVSSGGCVVCRGLWWAAHPESVQASRDKWEVENSVISAARKRRWRLENPEKLEAASRRWAAANPERVLETGRRWCRRNPDKVAVKTQRRRARIIAASGSHTASDVRVLLKAQKGRCAYCRTILSGKKHLDHIKPLSAGGSNDRTNLQWLCAICNLAKGAKDPLVFAQELGRLL